MRERQNENEVKTRNESDGTRRVSLGENRRSVNDLQYFGLCYNAGWLGSRVVSVLDSGAEGFESRSRDAVG